LRLSFSRGHKENSWRDFSAFGGIFGSGFIGGCENPTGGGAHAIWGIYRRLE